MFEVVVLFTSLVTGNIEEYISKIKYDTEEHCKAQQEVLDQVVDGKLGKLDGNKDPYVFDSECRIFYQA